DPNGHRFGFGSIGNWLGHSDVIQTLASGVHEITTFVKSEPLHAGGPLDVLGGAVTVAEQFRDHPRNSFSTNLGIGVTKAVGGWAVATLAVGAAVAVGAPAAVAIGVGIGVGFVAGRLLDHADVQKAPARASPAARRPAPTSVIQSHPFGGPMVNR